MARRKFLSQLAGLPFLPRGQSPRIEEGFEDHDEEFLGDG